MIRACAVLGFVSAALALAPPAGARSPAYELQPSKADPGVRAFDDPSYALIGAGGGGDVPLVVFLPGTGGKPRGGAALLSVIAGQGYRVIGLGYDDTPAVAQVCPADPDPDCSESFRRMRVDGAGHAVVSNPPAEAITARLAAQLAMLARTAPNEHWERYLADGQPRWDRIVVSGLSQGAGMAAYIAKHHAVCRVVLFSSPWDVTGPDHHPAPWLSQPSQTPPDRWWAEYHAKENTAGLIRAAYAALQIPPDHIRVFTQDIPSDFRGNSPNPYHVNTIRDLRYAPDWRIMFGRATGQ